MKYIIGNWKANKNLKQVNEWLDVFLSHNFSNMKGLVEIVICPPYPFIPLLAERTKEYECIRIGSQDLSRMPSGAYTGEVSAGTLKGQVRYSILGHSERRQYFGEDEKILAAKLEQCLRAKITPVFCVRGTDDFIPQTAKFVAYEPVHAIGTGANEPVEDVLRVRDNLKLPKGAIFIYGGSVTDANVTDYLGQDQIDGVLPGGSSLDPKKFFSLTKTVAQL